MSCIVSTLMFNGAKWFRRFTNCVDRLTYPGLSVQIVASSSTDGSDALLNGWCFKMENKERACSTVYVNPPEGSRMAKMAFLRNNLLEYCQDADYVFMIDSDVVMFPSNLIELLLLHKKDIVAPMVYIEGMDQFYDTFAFRLGGVRFDVAAPEHPFIPSEVKGGGLVELTSVGTCYLMSGEVARAARYGDGDCEQVVFCEDARRKGYKVWVDSTVRVEHVDLGAYGEAWR